MTASDAPAGTGDGLPPGGGETGALIRARDWSQSPLGPMDRWPQSLKTTLGLILHSAVPIVMLWGTRGVMLYNDAYSVFAGGRHPRLLGAEVREGWPEAAEFNAHVLQVCLAGGVLAYRDQEMTLYRHGFAEQVWMDLDYSPVFDGEGRPAGVIAIVVETTERVVGDRRRQFLGDLGDALRLLSDPRAVVDAAAERLGRHLGVDRVGYAEVNVEGEESVVVVRGDWCAPGVASLAGRPAFVAADDRALDDLASGRPVVMDDLAAEPSAAAAVAAAYGDGAIGAQIVWPLVKNGRVGAVFFVHDASPRVWTPEETLLAHEVAERTWASIERATAESHLLASEERLRLGLEAGRMVTWERDFVSGRMSMSDNAKEIFGPVDSPEDAYRRLSDEDAERVRRNFEAALEDPAKAYEVEHPYERPDGNRIWLYSSGRIVRDDAGRPLRAHGVTLDVTTRKTAELELQRLNSLLAVQVDARTRERDRILELSEDLITVAAQGFRLMMVNPAWTRLTGYTEAELLSTSFDTFFHPDDRPAMAAVMAKLNAGHPVIGFEDRILCADGREVTVSWNAIPDADGMIYAVGRDVTAEREREEALRQAQKMDAVGQLTGGIAHDFNNLLGAVIGSFELIREHADDAARVQRYAEGGLAAADRGARLTGQLLAFSRSQKIELQPMIPAKVIAGMRELLARTLGPGVRLSMDLADGMVAIRSDPLQLELALLNLAINARDAMPEGGDLTVRTRAVPLEADPELADGEYFELSVSDTGHGMSEQVMSRALNPFFTTKEVGKGSGLGLSQVYGVARQSGGAVRLQSREGQGATVRILLPCVPSRQPAVPVDPPDPAPSVGARARALVIDDDDDMRLVISQSLEAIGYDVRSAGGGEDGLALLDRDPADVLVVDFAMPGMNGVEVARAARQRLHDLQVVFVSGYADSTAIEQGWGEGSVLVRKPFRMEALHQAIQQALTGRDQGHRIGA